MPQKTRLLIPVQALQKLKHLCRDNLSQSASDCYAYGYDNSRKHETPDAVIFAENPTLVQAVVAVCYEYSIPLIARGRGTGTTGGSVPVHGGIVLSFERMNRICELDPNNRLMIVEPGVTNAEVQTAAAQLGFFWPPDPTSADYCTVGGNLGFNSAGPRAVKYGTTRENTLGLRAVTGTGAEIRTGVHTTKGVVGYDFTRLLIGSEGTLAVITEAILKLTPLPESKRTLQLYYLDIEQATQAIAAIMRQPVIPCALEFMDSASLQLVRESSELPIPPEARALLLVEVDGIEACLDLSVAHLLRAATNAGLVASKTATNATQAQELWAARKALSPALRRIAPKKINEDVVVPVAQIPELISRLTVLSARYGIPIVNFGHAGNGNIHVNLLFDPENEQQRLNAPLCLNEVFDTVIALRGTLSGEHGVGMEKQNFIGKEIDPVTLDLMRRIKTQFDPRGILNPGKIFPELSTST